MRLIKFIVLTGMTLYHVQLASCFASEGFHLFLSHAIGFFNSRARLLVKDSVQDLLGSSWYMV